MKIAAFEVRPDEKTSFARWAKVYHADVTEYSEVPSLENASLAAGCVGVTFLGQGKINRELLAEYKKLGVKCVSTRTIGSDHIDLEAAKELGILVCNANYAPDSVADFTIMMMLMCLRQYKQAFWRGYVNDFSLAGLEGRNLSAMTVGVMGTGRIGQRVIRDLTGFGCRILAYDVYQNAEVAKLAEYVDLDTLWARSDVIFLHCPLFPETQGIINRDTIEKMKAGVILINNSRGQLVVERDLADALNSGKVYAAGLDVVSTEPIRGDNPLLRARNCIITPHISWAARESRERILDTTVENIRAFLDGSPVHVVN